MNYPIIKLEVEGMKQTMVAAFMKYQMEMDAYVKETIEKVCTEENIKMVIQQSAAKALKDAIDEEVRAFFRYGDGRKAVAAAVKESIINKESYTLLDEV